jgi:hypothetical protein
VSRLWGYSVPLLFDPSQDRSRVTRPGFTDLNSPEVGFAEPIGLSFLDADFWGIECHSLRDSGNRSKAFRCSSRSVNAGYFSVAVSSPKSGRRSVIGVADNTVRTSNVIELVYLKLARR